MRRHIGLFIIIGIGFVFTLGSLLAIVELGTGGRTTSCSNYSTFGRSVCTTSGGTSPVVYVILAVALIIGWICLAAGITVLAVRISAPPAGAAPAQAAVAQQAQPNTPQAYWDGTKWVVVGGSPTS
jgi:hypothetical protein